MELSLQLPDESIEERADQLTDEEIVNCTALSDFFEEIHSALTSRGTKLIAGPRGCGKTHLMRYTWIKCKSNKNLPLCLYVSFNRYLRLEPYLSGNSDAIGLFHSWVLARILLSICDFIDSHEEIDNVELKSLTEAMTGYSRADIESYITNLEKGNSSVYVSSDVNVGTEDVINAIDKTTAHYKRKRAVILLDDAALTLTPDYMRTFFDMVRVLKTPTISLKASVYPGTTEYGPKFHVNHEAERISIWLDVKDRNYSRIMGEIATNRMMDISDVPDELVELLKYAAFGIPRAFLTMLREFKRKKFTTAQQGINQIIQSHNSWRDSEYQSFAIKIPEFSDLIDAGSILLNEIVSKLKKANSELNDSDERQIIIGVSEFESALAKRMVNFLVEAGMLYEHSIVSHGEDRVYQRYTPHFSKLIQARVFSSGSRGFSPSRIVEFISRRDAKHPVRTSIQNLIGNARYENLKLNLPPCAKCNTPRLSEVQKFCHNCGEPLVDQSTYQRCMSVDLASIPTMTDWQRSKISETGIRTIGEFLTLQDPGTELRKIKQIGQRRAGKMIGGVDQFVDEFLS